METSVTYMLVGIAVLAAASVLHFTAIRPRLRAARLVPFRNALAATMRQRPARLRCDEQDQVLDALKSLDDADALADSTEKKARTVQIPTPPAGAAGASPEEQLKGLTSFLLDPRVGLAVAGGEQLVGNLFAMAVPGAAKVLGEAAMHGFWNGVHEALTDPEGLAELGLGVLEASFQEGGIHAKEVAWSVAEHVLEGAAGGVGEGVWEHAGDAFDPGAADGAHFPVVTALLSSYREIRLLRQEKTSLDRAVGHVALDTGATAAGSFAGAKAGAAVGTFIAPGVGTAIGGFVGAIVGGVGGRMFATTVKEQPLKEALASYSETSQSAEATVTASGLAMLTGVRQQAAMVQADYQNALRPAPRLEHLQRGTELIEQTLELRMAVVSHLGTLAAQSEAALTRTEDLIPGTNALQRLLGLDVRPEAMRELSTARAELDREECIPSPSILPDLAMTRSRPIATCRLLATTAWPDSHTLRSQFRPIERILREARDSLVRTLGMWAGQSAQSYRKAVKQLTTCLEDEAERHLTLVAAQREVLSRKRDVVEKQRAALGR